jgi:RND family efflux transporter MFP subunit
MKRLLVGTIATAAVAACGHPEPEPRPVVQNVSPTLTVTAEPLATVLPVHGTVQGVNRASLSTRMMARVTAVTVEVGARVETGQVLVRLGVDDIEANRAKADAALSVARAGLAEAERHAARMDTLLAQDAVARVQRDQAVLQRTHAAAQLAMAEAAVAEVEAADRYAAIRAPFAGFVVQRSVSVGDLAAPGMSLIGIEGDGAREAILAVPVDMAAELETAAPVRVVEPGGREVVAPVRAVAAGADPRTRTVEVRVTLPADWPTGIAVTALVPGREVSTIAIPAHAVVRRGQLTGVRVLTDDGAVLRWIRLGRAVSPEQRREGVDQERVEVLSGLAVGDRIVL